MNTSSPPANLPVSLAANPKLSSWLKFSSDGRVTVSPGKVEIGQGIVTALAQIAADELDVETGRALRHACADVRRIFLAAASDRLGVGIDALRIEDGTISGPGNVRTSYWELAMEVSLDRDATAGAAPK